MMVAVWLPLYNEIIQHIWVEENFTKALEKARCVGRVVDSKPRNHNGQSR